MNINLKSSFIWLCSFLVVIGLIFGGFHFFEASKTQTQAQAKKDTETQSPVTTVAKPSVAQPSGAIAQQPRKHVSNTSRPLRERAEIKQSRATDNPSFISAKPGEVLYQGDKSASHSQNAAAFFKTQGTVLGVRNAEQELSLVNEQSDEYGTTHLTYQQQHDGIPVFGAKLKVHFNSEGDIYSVNGNFIPDITVSNTPSISISDAQSNALRASADAHKVTLGAVQARDPALMYFRDGLINAKPGDNKLVYEVPIRGGGPTSPIAENVYIDAHSGEYVERISSILHGQTVQRRGYSPPDVASCQAAIADDQATDNDIREVCYPYPDVFPNAPVWSEGDALPVTSLGNAENKALTRALTGAQSTYRLFRDAFGRDSYDGKGSVLNVQLFPDYNNAYATAQATPADQPASTNFGYFASGNGVLFDGEDVVGHEIGHQYILATAGLVYTAQPGALNESYADIWGQIVDLLNTGTMDIDNDTNHHNRRGLGKCSLYERVPLRAFISEPASLAGVLAATPATFGPTVEDPVFPPTEVGALVDDGDASTPSPTASPGSTSDACQPLLNGAAVAGKIALADRGGCNFIDKFRNVQAAGAIGIVVVNDQGDALVNMGPPSSDVCLDPATCDITIKGYFIGQSDGTAIKNELGNQTVVFAVGENPELVKEDNTRWLIGEDTLGGNIGVRDMWTPGCKNDFPGSVSEGLWCRTPDDFGVHVNSGPPNRAFALMVDGTDGESLNNQVIEPLDPNPMKSLTKAAHIEYRAMTTYLTDTSVFADKAAALTHACGDLIGFPLRDLTTGMIAKDAARITAHDCEQVSKAIAAVELADPTNCNLTNTMDLSAPQLCPTGQHFVNIFTDNLDDPNEAVDPKWTQSGYIVDPDLASKDTARFTFNNIALKNLDFAYVSSSPTLPLDDLFQKLDNVCEDFGAPPGCANVGVAINGPLVRPEDRINESHVQHLDSPLITLPSGKYAPRMVFKHLLHLLGDTIIFGSDLSISGLANYDSALLQVSTNGGPFQVIAPKDYCFDPDNMLGCFNPPRDELVPSDLFGGFPIFGKPGNTNPLARPESEGPIFTFGGQLAGGDFGEGTFNADLLGYSRIDLSNYASPGDTIQLRFSLGFDVYSFQHPSIGNPITGLQVKGAEYWVIDGIQVYRCMGQERP